MRRSHASEPGGRLKYAYLKPQRASSNELASPHARDREEITLTQPVVPENTKCRTVNEHLRESSTEHRIKVAILLPDSEAGPIRQVRVRHVALDYFNGQIWVLL